MKTRYKIFISPKEVDSWFEKYKSYFPSDNDTDKEFVKVLENYVGSANIAINNTLRYGTSITEDDFIQSISQKMLDKLQTYHIPDDIVVYRYISKGLLKAMCPSYPLQKGMVLQDKGFMSTTLFRESVNSYRDGRNQNILLAISIPSGTKGTYVGRLENTLSEYEVILAPNTKLRIDYKIPFCNRYFKCTVVDY